MATKSFAVELSPEQVTLIKEWYGLESDGGVRGFLQWWIDGELKLMEGVLNEQHINNDCKGFDGERVEREGCLG